MTKKIDINCDMGESYYDKKIGNDSKIMPYITSCNIACGFHGGDPNTIKKTIELAIKYDVKIGAHPSYFDLEGFGRRKVNLKLNELESIILYQVSALKGITESYGKKLHHVKPHGALYNKAVNDEDTALGIIEAIKSISSDLIHVVLAGSKWESLAQDQNV